MIEDVAVHLDVDFYLVPAERVVALGASSRIIERLEVSWPSPVIEDQLLIKIPEIGHHPKTSLTL
jgi:hypothetical protein